MQVTLSVAITFGAFDPRRKPLLDALLRSLGDGPEAISKETHAFTVIADKHGIGQPPVGRKAWEWGVASGSTHHLVLEEDTLAAPDFLAGARLALEHSSGAPVSFFYTRKRGLVTAKEAGSSWLRTRSNVFGQAICLPTDMARDFLDWDKRVLSGLDLFTDARVSLYLYHLGIPFWVTVPSLIQHVGAAYSLFHHSVPGKASSFADGSALDVDWSRGCPSPPMEKDRGLVSGFYRQYVTDRNPQ